MAFRFSLATVLRYRDSMEKRAELALKRVLMEIARTRLQIEQLTRQIARAQAAIEKTLQQPVSAIHLQCMVSEIDAFVDRKKGLIESLAALERQRQLQMQAYQAAHRDRKMLSEMANRQREAYEQDRARREQKFVDDIFAARARRND
jgi:flagellar export protein FliJ